MAEVALVIYDSKLFDVGHNIRRWADRLEARFTMNAIAAAPERSGDLKAGIHGWVTRIGPRHLETVIESTAPYSLYVLRGTYGPIMSPNFTEEGRRRKMRLPAYGPWPEKRLLTVSGQRAQDFFATAARQTGAVHSSIRGFEPEYGYGR